MKLTFLGTRGELEARTWRHHVHSSLLVSYRGAAVMVDCGLGWLGKFEPLCPAAISSLPSSLGGLESAIP